MKIFFYCFLSYILSNIKCIKLLLSEIFLQLRISEKTGRGVPIIVNTYSIDSIKIEDDAITVTIPFNRINEMGDKTGDKINFKLNLSQAKVLAEIRNNPNITKPQLSIKCGLGKTRIDNIISDLNKLD